MNKLYLKLAWSNLKNSRQFYLPYVIAGMLSAMMFYTMCALNGAKPNPVYFFKKVFAVVVNFTRK